MEDTITAPNQPAALPGQQLTLTDLMATSTPIQGKHRAPVDAPVIPSQRLRHDEDDTPVTPVALTRPVGPAAPVRVPTQATGRPALHEPTPVRQVAPVEIPHEAHWRASHLPRVIVSALLVLSALGTIKLGVRYAHAPASNGLLSLVIGIAVVVVLWALAIASTPQTVSLDGSILTVHNTGGSERFDLADALQPVDLVGDPHTSHWAVLLHRANDTTLVLRRNDVDPIDLDPIVRHYRNAATQRLIEREARFNL